MRTNQPNCRWPHDSHINVSVAHVKLITPVTVLVSISSIIDSSKKTSHYKTLTCVVYLSNSL